jgi:hypothetical protein
MSPINPENMKTSILIVLLTLAGLACTQMEQEEQQNAVLEKIAKSAAYEKLYQAQGTLLLGLVSDQYDLEAIGVLLKSKVNVDVCDWRAKDLSSIRGAAEYQKHNCQLRFTEAQLKAAYPDFFKGANAEHWQDLQRRYELQHGLSLSQKLIEISRHKN